MQSRSRMPPVCSAPSSNLRLVASILLLLSAWTSLLADAQLSSSDYYYRACPGGMAAIRRGIRRAVYEDRRMAASLIRLHFHDCFGCDVSVLLDDAPSIDSVKLAAPNFNSVRGFEVIDGIKAEVERICPGAFSCADLIAVAARDASASVGGPSWSVELGRRDSRTASRRRADSDIPSFTASLGELIAAFDSRGLAQRDLVALSGAARCLTFRDRIDNASNIDPGFAACRQRSCSTTAFNGDDDNLTPLDVATPYDFDNHYFRNLFQGRGLAATDQALIGDGGPTEAIVHEYAANWRSFYRDFSRAMIKMGRVQVLTGSSGEIRKSCMAMN